MFFRQLSAPGSSLSYLFGCGGLCKAVAVDVVAGDEEWFVDEASKAKSAITHVIDTHVHADHYSGGRQLAQRVGAQYCLHASARINFPCLLLNDLDTIVAGNVQIMVLHTPGHTEDSVCLLVTDMRRGPEPWFLLTGDTLFVGGVGRPDLARQEHEMAGKLFDSLHRKLLTLPDYLEFFPGHQAGSVCGSGLSGKPSSTLGFEKRCNPLLAIKDKQEFIRMITATIPPCPAEMDKIVQFNTAA